MTREDPITGQVRAITQAERDDRRLGRRWFTLVIGLYLLGASMLAAGFVIGRTVGGWSRAAPNAPVSHASS